MRHGAATAAPRPDRRWRSCRSSISACRCVRHQQLLPVDPDAGADLGGVRRVVEHPVRLWRPVVVRPCVVLRHRRLHRDAGAGLLEPDALARHSAGHGGGRGRRGADRHCRHSACAAIISRCRCSPIRWRSCTSCNTSASRKCRCRCIGSIRRRILEFTDPRYYTLVAVGLLVVGVLACMLVENSRFGLALLAIRQNELAAEAAGHRCPPGRCARWSFRHDRGGGRRALCLRAAGGHAGFRVRHAGFGAAWW